MSSEHFTLNYDTSGADAVSAQDTGRTVSRSDGVVIGYAVANNGVPDYVEEAAIGLEYSYDVYLASGLRLPSHQMVYIKADLGAYGLYLPECHDIYLEHDLVGVTRTAAHELAHAVQYQYWDLSDFAEIPGPEQAFYKEASADAMMIQVMRPSPYVSWFDEPDARYLLEAGTGAAFFWVYFGERFSHAVPQQDLLPGLTGMARYLELVAEPGLDLRDALELLPVDQEGIFLDDVMEDLVVANLLEDLLSPVDPTVYPEIDAYDYTFSHVRGFYNKVSALSLEAGTFALVGPSSQGLVRTLSLEGQVQHLWNADYFEIDSSLARAGGWAYAQMSTEGQKGVAFLIAMSLTESDVKVLQTRRLEDGWLTLMGLPHDSNLRLFVVVQSMEVEAFSYRLDFTLVNRPR